MKRRTVLTHEFVEYIPNKLEDGTLYVCKVFGTAAHKCCCGCGKEVITPIGPTDWRLNFEGATVSLYPSIGNWSFECQSHYWIKRSKVIWVSQWSKREIEAGRSSEREEKEQYFRTRRGPTVPSDSLWNKLMKWLFNR